MKNQFCYKNCAYFWPVVCPYSSEKRNSHMTTTRSSEFISADLKYCSLAFSLWSLTKQFLQFRKMMRYYLHMGCQTWSFSWLNQQNCCFSSAILLFVSSSTWQGYFVLNQWCVCWVFHHNCLGCKPCQLLTSSSNGWILPWCHLTLWQWPHSDFAMHF